MNNILVTMSFLVWVLFFNSGCAVFSDGAVVDYSRLFNVPLTIAIGGGGGALSGESSPWEADTGYKQKRGIWGNEPWSTWSHSGPTKASFINHTDQWGGRTETCNTVGEFTFCN